jgi:hypothetical protein
MTNPSFNLPRSFYTRGLMMQHVGKVLAYTYKVMVNFFFLIMIMIDIVNGYDAVALILPLCNVILNLITGTLDSNSLSYS